MKKIYELINKYSVVVLSFIIVLFVFSSYLKINRLREVGLLVVFLYLIAVVVSLVIMGLFIVAVGFHNFVSCDDDLFDKVDSFCKKGVDSDCRMKDFIRVINYYYAEGGIVDKEIVKAGDIQRLYKRKDHILKRMESFKNAWTLLCSFSFSIVFSGFFSMDSDVYIETIISTVVGVLILVFLHFYYFYKRGVMGSFENYAYEWELRLLDKKIEEVEESLQIDFVQEKMLIAKKNAVTQIRSKVNWMFLRKKDKELIKKADEISELDLCSVDYKDYELIETMIEGETGIIARNKNIGESGNQSKEQNDLEKFYEIWHTN